MSEVDPSEFARGRRIVVLGGTGFLGIRLVERASRLGAQVTSCGREQVDITGGPAALRAVLASADVVFNLAGRSGPVSSGEDPRADLQVNVLGSLAVLEAAVEVAPAARVVFASSRLVYGRPASSPVRVGDETHPTSFYGVHKLAAEGYHRLFEQQRALETTVLRITNPYGPRAPGASPAYGIVNWFIERALAGQPLTVYGDGAQLRDYCYVDDVVDALLLAGLHPAARGRTFNIGSGRGIPFVEMARAVARAALAAGAPEVEVQQVPWPDAARQVETGDFVADVAPAAAELGWRPVIGLDEGLARTVAHLQQVTEPGESP